MISGIYTIENLVNGKLYVGYAINIDSRKINHIGKLRTRKHKNQYLQAAWDKYGEDKFRFEVIEYCDKEYLHTMEHYWCNILNVHDKKYGYNMRPTHPYGNPTHSKETREKLGRGSRGKPCPEHVKEANRNRKHTEDVKKLIAEAGKRRVLSEESRKKMSDKQKRAAERKGLLSQEEKKKRRIERSKEYKKRKNDGWKRSYRIGVYNKDNSLYNRYMTKADALCAFGMKRNSASKLLQVIDKDILYLDKYWKYENTNNISTS